MPPIPASWLHLSSQAIQLCRGKYSTTHDSPPFDTKRVRGLTQPLRRNGEFGFSVWGFGLEFEFDVVAFDPYQVAGHTSWRWQAQYAPGRHVESGAVPGAGDRCPLNDTFWRVVHPDGYRCRRLRGRFPRR